MNHIIQIEKIIPASWGINCQSWTLKNSNELSIKYEMMPPGTQEQMHFHQESSQFFFILKGRASFVIDDQKINLIKDEAVSIRPFQIHVISNESDENLEFLLISNPSTNQDRIYV